jgi:UPF0755 protein
MALVAAAVVALIVGGGFLLLSTVRGWFGAPADYKGAGFGNVLVQVNPGDSLTAIGQTLAGKEVVRSVGAFTDAANDSTAIGPGYYRMHKHMQASLAVRLLLNPSSLVQSRVTIPEGRRMLGPNGILAAIAAATDITMGDLTTASQAPATLGVPGWGAGHSLEGFLFPATYDFPPGTTATEALTAMVTRFNQAATDVGLVGGARKLGKSPYEVLTLASMVEREGRVTADFPKIAEVFYNRLHRGMTLGSDATLFYVLPPDHGPSLSPTELHTDSPYNTRLHTGLPPTPIASPGETALRAALHPAKGPYLYFVTINKAGDAAFATTLDEFNTLVAQSRRNGVR